MHRLTIADLRPPTATEPRFPRPSVPAPVGPPTGPSDYADKAYSHSYPGTDDR